MRKPTLQSDAAYGGDQAIVLSLAQMLPGESVKVLQNLARARNQKNMTDVEIHSHALKGMCGMFEGASGGRSGARS